MAQKAPRRQSTQQPPLEEEFLAEADVDDLRLSFLEHVANRCTAQELAILKTWSAAGAFLSRFTSVYLVFSLNSGRLSFPSKRREAGLLPTKRREAGFPH